MARSRTSLRVVSGSRRGARVRRRHGWLSVPAFLIAGALGGVVLGLLPDEDLARVLEVPRQAAIAIAPQQFDICSGRVRVDCVVDGDTFWLDGTRIRIADINTPEVSSPACAAEAALGRRATVRLSQLLAAGPFELVPIDRDEDVYGRKLRIVMRNGRSIGDTLIAEGLAHRWRGYRQDWC